MMALTGTQKRGRKSIEWGNLGDGLADEHREEQAPVLFSVKSKSGLLLGSRICGSESFADLKEALLHAVPAPYRDQVKYIKTDAPLVASSGDFSPEFPCVVAVVEDVLHAKFRTEKFGCPEAVRSMKLVNDAFFMFGRWKQDWRTDKNKIESESDQAQKAFDEVLKNTTQKAAAKKLEEFKKRGGPEDFKKR